MARWVWKVHFELEKNVPMNKNGDMGNVTACGWVKKRTTKTMSEVTCNLCLKYLEEDKNED